MNKMPNRGLYAITDTDLSRGRDFARDMRQCLAGGARIIQYRDKTGERDRRRREAEILRALCSEYQAILLINDDLELAAETGADGVHLGREDASLEQARRVLGDTAIIGLSCYNELERARRAVAGGADYLAFGRFFPSRIKPGAVQAEPSLLRQVRAEFGDPPIVAIGGITPDNGRVLIEAGADYLAVIHGLFGQPDIRAAAQAYHSLFV